MLFQKAFKNLPTAMAILVLLNNFEGKICFNYLPLIGPLPDMTYVVRTFSIDTCQRRTNYCCIEDVQKCGKILFTKTIVESGW